MGDKHTRGTTSTSDHQIQSQGSLLSGRDPQSGALVLPSPSEHESAGNSSDAGLPKSEVAEKLRSCALPKALNPGLSPPGSFLPMVGSQHGSRGQDLGGPHALPAIEFPEMGVGALVQVEDNQSQAARPI